MARISTLWEGVTPREVHTKGSGGNRNQRNGLPHHRRGSDNKDFYYFFKLHLFPESSPIVFKARVTDKGSVRAQSVMGKDIKNKELH